MNCKICGNKLESDDTEGICKDCRKEQENYDMDELACNIIYSSFNPGI